MSPKSYRIQQQVLSTSLPRKFIDLLENKLNKYLQATNRSTIHIMVSKTVEMVELKLFLLHKCINQSSKVHSPLIHSNANYFSFPLNSQLFTKLRPLEPQKLRKLMPNINYRTT